jgi:hypothetical protein
MPDSSEGGAVSGWSWIDETALELGGSFTFARGAPPGRVMET